MRVLRCMLRTASLKYIWILANDYISEFVVDFPVGQVKTALQLSSEEFKEKYGGEKPQQTDNIVFSCLAGIRSKQALDAATSLGYKEWEFFLSAIKQFGDCLVTGSHCTVELCWFHLWIALDVNNVTEFCFYRNKSSK